MLKIRAIRTITSGKLNLHLLHQAEQRRVTTRKINKLLSPELVIYSKNRSIT